MGVKDEELASAGINGIEEDEEAAKKARIQASQIGDSKKRIGDNSFATSAQFAAIQDEMTASSFFASLQDRDTDATWLRSDCKPISFLFLHRIELN